MSKVFVRHEVHSPAGQTAVKEYAKAVARMMEREKDDVTSWTYQAAIHGSEKGQKKLWNQCEHASWFFLPWHRMYVYYFERIVRKAVVDTGGSADWALPYWDYGLGGNNAEIPEPFRQPGNSGNPLFTPHRGRIYNEGAKLPPRVISDVAALARPHFIGNAEFGGAEAPPGKGFWGLQGELESTPHNDVHSTIGGWMGNPATAAQDPVFWLHHSNIDRIWAIWNESKHRTDPTKSSWLKQKFEFFDEHGKLVSKSCDEVLNTVNDLGYTYDPSPAGIVEKLVQPASIPPSGATPPPSEPKFVGASEKTVPLEGESIEVPLAIDDRAKQEVLEAADPEDPRRLYLNVEDIRGESNPSTVYGVYLNLPSSPSDQDLERHYLGNISFFGIERSSEPAGDEHPHGMRMSFEVGHLIRALRGDADWEQGQLEVSFRPVTPDPEAHPAIHIGRVSLSIDA